MFRTHLSMLFALLSLVAMATVSAAADAKPANKLLVILLDGFRWDYFNLFGPNELPAFNRLRQMAVRPEALVPVFPSLSFVNYYALMTGLYPESNGMVDNYMWDEKYQKEFLIGDNPDQYYSFWWDDGEPVWITAAKQGKKSYIWYWNGCEVEIRGHRPTFCSPYQSTPDPSFANFSIGLRQAVDVLRNGTADYAGVYLERSDADGHRYGPASENIKTTIRSIDTALGVLLDQIGSPDNDINILVFADHGMAERVGGPSNASAGMINICQYIDCDHDWQHAYSSTAGPVLHIWPWPNKTQSVYERLRNAHPNLTVYKKEDIPDKYHFKNHYRVGPIFLKVDKGYAIVRNPNTTALPTIGFHGYDNIYSEMGAIFFAAGPDFKKNTTLKIGQLPNINLYQLMCHVMKLTPSPHNGTWSTVCDGLADDTACSTGPWKPPPAPGPAPAGVGRLTSTWSWVLILLGVVTRLSFQ